MSRKGSLSNNIVSIINKILSNKEIIQLIQNNSEYPHEQSVSLPAYHLVNDRIFPFPFVEEAQDEATIQLRIYSGKGRMNRRILENNLVYIDIVLHKRLWTVYHEDGNRGIRPNLIVDALIDCLNEKYLESVGKLIFSEYHFVNFNEKFNGYTTTWNIVTSR